MSAAQPLQRIGVFAATLHGGQQHIPSEGRMRKSLSAMFLRIGGL